MKNIIKNIFVTKKNVETIEDRCYRIGNLFARLLVKQFLFDKVEVVVENPFEIDSKSFIYTSLVDAGHLKNVDSEFALHKTFSKYTDKTNKKIRFITLRLTRKYSDDINMNEIRYMFGYINEKDENLYFLKEYPVDLFGHYKITYPYLEELGRFTFVQSYYFNTIENKLFHSIELPLLYENEQLSLLDPKTSNYLYPNYKTYLISIKTNIIEQRFSKFAVISILFGDNILKSYTCEILDKNSFIYNISKILFPFNLTLEELKNLNLNKESLNQISRCFDEKFEDCYLMRKKF